MSKDHWNKKRISSNGRLKESLVSPNDCKKDNEKRQNRELSQWVTSKCREFQHSAAYKISNFSIYFRKKLWNSSNGFRGESEIKSSMGPKWYLKNILFLYFSTHLLGIPFFVYDCVKICDYFPQLFRDYFPKFAQIFEIRDILLQSFDKIRDFFRHKLSNFAIFCRNTRFFLQLFTIILDFF